MKRRSSLRLGVLLASSLAIHAALLWSLSGHEPPSLPPPRVEPVLFEIVERPPPAPSAPAPGARAATKVKAKRAGVAATMSAPAAAIATQPLESDVPLAEALPASSGRSLLPSVKSPEPELSVRLGLAPAPGEGLRAPLTLEPERLVSSTVTQSVGRHRVASGNYPAYFSELRDVLIIAWDVERLIQRRGGKAARTRTLVRLEQDPAGVLLRADVLAPSTDRELDRELLADLYRAANSLPTPPPEVTLEREAFASIWELEYVPGGGVQPGSFDLVTLIDKRAIPKPNPKKVRLLSLE